MAAVKNQQNKNGGTGTKTSPYWAKGPSYTGTWQYTYMPGYTYYDANNQPFTPSTEQIESGFLHFTGGVWYKTNSTITGIKLIQANIKDCEAQIAQLTKDLEGLKEAEKLLNDNPAYAMILDLHNRGLL